MTNKIIYAFTNPTLVPSSLKDGEEVIMARRLRQFFLEEGGRPTAAPNAASARDDVDEHTTQNGGTA